MMKDKAWINQYMEKANTKPDFLLNWEGEGFAPGVLEALKSKLGSYSEVYLELGSGSGQHLIERAEANPQALYLGVELRYKRAYRTVEKAEKRGLTNLAVIRSDAKHIDVVVPRQTLSGIFINFPDPWNKRRWHKHRMLRPEFLPVLHALLSPSGFLAYKTDHKEAFDDAKELLVNSGLFNTECLEFDLYGSPLIQGNVATEFEMLFLSKGLPIFYWRGIRKEPNPLQQVA